MTPAQQVDPASYYSFIDLSTFHHRAERTNRPSRSHTLPGPRRPFQVFDRPTSFLDLGGSDPRILDHRPHTADLTLEDDQLPSYEEARCAPVYLEGNTVQRNTRRRYIERSKLVLLRSSQDPMSPSPNPVVTLPTRPAQHAYRPLPPAPPPYQTHVIFTTPLDTEEQSLHVDELVIVPAQVVLQNGEGAKWRRRYCKGWGLSRA